MVVLLSPYDQSVVLHKTMENSRIYDLVDLERYPIKDLAGQAGQRLVAARRLRIQAILGFSTAADLGGKLESSILHYDPRFAQLEGVEQ